MTRATLARGAGFVGAAVAGGVVALVGAAATGHVFGTTTIREVEVSSPLAATAPAVAQQRTGAGLTIGEIYERTKSGVVQVNSRIVIRQERDPIFPIPFGSAQEQRTEEIGSGFVIDRAGHIVTNYHVVRDADEVTVSFSNRDRVGAKIVGVDPSTDVAVLKVDEKSRALSPLTLGRSSAVRVGDPVFAIGNPFGLERSLTAGIVSALQRRIAAPTIAPAAIDEVIQTDAQINQGNSGGPLLNARGEVIGVNTAVLTGTASESGNLGIGFAVPIDTVRQVAAQLIAEGRVERPFLGVGVHEITEELAEVFQLPTDRGLIVHEVRRGSAADRAGLRAGPTQVVVEGESYVLGGDVIVRVAGRNVTTEHDLRRVITAHKPGDEIEIEILRGDERMTLTTELGHQPTTTG